MKKLLFSFAIIFSAILSSYAQDGYFRIHVASLKKGADSVLYSPLSQYGFISYESSDNGFTRVYLDRYVGKSTADHILKLVKKKGFKKAYTVALDSKPRETNTLQIASAKTINFDVYGAYKEEIKSRIYVHLESGKYHYYLGVFNGDSPDVIAPYKKMATQMGISAPLVKSLVKKASPEKAKKTKKTKKDK